MHDMLSYCRPFRFLREGPQCAEGDTSECAAKIIANTKARFTQRMGIFLLGFEKQQQKL